MKERGVTQRVVCNHASAGVAHLSLAARFAKSKPGMRLRLSLVCQTLLLLILCLLVFGSPTARVAYAASPLGSSQASVSVKFHAKYNAGRSAYVHSGIDLPAAVGAKVYAPCKGRVSFVGRVPSGDSVTGSSAKGSASATMLAISLKLDDGKTLTLMPIDASNVAKGESVAQGEALGTLAASGDRSSSATHLHMGLKQNGVYHDPSYLLGLAAQASVGQTAAAAAPLTAKKATPSASSAKAKKKARAQAAAGEGTAAVEVGAAEGSSASEEALSSELRTQSSAEAAATNGLEQAAAGSDAKADAQSFGSIASSAEAVSAYDSTQAQEGPGGLEGLAAAAHAALEAKADAVASACGAQATRLMDCLNAVGAQTGIPLTVLLLGVLLLVTGVMAATLYGAARAVKHIAPLLLEKKNYVLKSLTGGDNISRLFPAPGTTFMTRGR